MAFTNHFSFFMAHAPVRTRGMFYPLFAAVAVVALLVLWRCLNYYYLPGNLQGMVLWNPNVMS
jgi:hypothetical protein